MQGYKMNDSDVDINEAVRDELGPGWYTAIDPSSGNPYYYHGETRAVTWVS